jgi:integrase/recombinase XerD
MTERMALAAVRPETDWDTAIAAFCFSRKLKGCTESTLKWYHDRLHRFANYCKLLNETPATFSRATVFAFFAQLQQRGVTAQTINGFRRALSAFSSFLRSEDFRDDDPLWGVEKLKEPVPFPRTLSDAQLDALLAAPDPTTFVGLRDYTLILLLADNGLRINEALSLTLDDLDLQNGFVFVRHAKGGKQRQVPLSHNTTLALRRYLSARFTHFPNISTRALFITEFGMPLRDQSFRPLKPRSGFSRRNFRSKTLAKPCREASRFPFPVVYEARGLMAEVPIAFLVLATYNLTETLR